MNLTEIAKDIYEYMQGKSLTDNQYNALEQAYKQCLSECNDANEIRHVLDMDDEIIFPLYLLIETYQKLIQIRRDPDELRLFAWYLRLHSPPDPEEEWQVQASELEQEAELLENASKD